MDEYSLINRNIWIDLLYAEGKFNPRIMMNNGKGDIHQRRYCPQSYILLNSLILLLCLYLVFSFLIIQYLVNTIVIESLKLFVDKYQYQF